MGQEEEEGPRNVTLLLSGHLQNLASQILQTIGPITGTFLRSGHLLLDNRFNKYRDQLDQELGQFCDLDICKKAI